MRRRGRYAKGVAKREEILRAALELYARRGRASLRELAARVNLTEAGVLHYFESKEDLFAAILRARDDADLATYRGDRNTVSGLLRIMRHNADVPGLVSLYATQSSAAAADPEHPARPYFHERYRMVRGFLTEKIREHQRDGRVRATLDADRVAALLVAAADGMQIQWMLDQDFDMADHIEYLLDALGIGGALAAEEAERVERTEGATTERDGASA